MTLQIGDTAANSEPEQHNVSRPINCEHGKEIIIAGALLTSVIVLISVMAAAATERAIAVATATLLFGVQ